MTTIFHLPPPEIIINFIIPHLNLADLINLGQTNKYLNSISNDEESIQNWLKFNNPLALTLILRLSKEINLFTLIKLEYHLKRGELVTENSYLFFGKERLARMSGR